MKKLLTCVLFFALITLVLPVRSQAQTIDGQCGGGEVPIPFETQADSAAIGDTVDVLIKWNELSNDQRDDVHLGGLFYTLLINDTNGDTLSNPHITLTAQDTAQNIPVPVDISDLTPGTQIEIVIGVGSIGFTTCFIHSEPPSVIAIADDDPNELPGKDAGEACDVNLQSSDDPRVVCKEGLECRPSGIGSDVGAGTCEIPSSRRNVDCPICPQNWHFRFGQCCQFFDCRNPEAVPTIPGVFSDEVTGSTIFVQEPTTESCQAFACFPGKGCDYAGADPVKPPCVENTAGECIAIRTSLGTDIQIDPSGLVRSIFGILLSISGMVALFIILKSGYQMMTSQGNPEVIQAAKDSLTSAIVGLLFLIFSMVILQVIGVDILQLPGFGT